MRHLLPLPALSAILATSLVGTGAVLTIGSEPGEPELSEAKMRAATLDAAKVIGKQAELGSIAPGKYADMIAVSDSRLEDISALGNIDHVMKGGAVIR